jgi:mRNA interferase MazF
MTPYKFGQIVLVPFPFTDQTGIKRRPAVVVSSDVYNSAHIDVVLMAVTSQTAGKLRQDEVEIDDWRGAGLLKESRIKPIFTTIAGGLVLRSLGTLTESDRNVLKTAISGILG